MAETVGELRKAIEGVGDNVDVIFTWDGVNWGRIDSVKIHEQNGAVVLSVQDDKTYGDVGRLNIGAWRRYFASALPEAFVAMRKELEDRRPSGAFVVDRARLMKELRARVVAEVIEQASILAHAACEEDARLEALMGVVTNGGDTK